MVSQENLQIIKSKIAGAGVMTKVPIKKGSTILILSGEVISLNEMSKRVDNDEEEGSDPLGIDWEVYMDLDPLPRTFNHSCNPNAYIKGKNKLVALRDIKAGEEIFFDYSTTMHDNEKKINKLNGILWTCKCKCGSENCRKIIHQFKTLPKERQEFYLKNKFAPDFILKEFK